MLNQNLNSRQCPSGSLPYVIRQGNTLAQIAKQYNSTVEEILKLNPSVEPANLLIGKEICVPLTIQLYPFCPTKNYYVVTYVDTFNSIANYFNVTTEQLYHSNYGIDPNDLYIDQILCIPVAPPPVSIVVDINQLELSVRNNGITKTYPIASFKENFPIPRGDFIILNKQVDPGVELGARWLGLSKAGFGIRGTNTPEFIDILASDNHIILSNQDISELFNLVTVGTKISILSEVSHAQSKSM